MYIIAFRRVEYRVSTPITGFEAAGRVDFRPISGGDLASTRVAKPGVHAEVQEPRKSFCKLIVANDDNYALAA
jgi:hypothetical protein